MMIMTPLNSNRLCHKWAENYPGQFGFLLGPSYYERNRMRGDIPIACDNDAYKAFKNKEPWNEVVFFKMLESIKVLGLTPMWVLVPDVVGNRDETLRNWERYADRVRDFGFPLAFAVQDGMTCHDVPNEAAVVFVGGSTKWKWNTASLWCATFSTHIGRVNSLRLVQRANEIGAISVDGSGWFRDLGDWGRSPTGLTDWFKGWRDRQTKFAI